MQKSKLCDWSTAVSLQGQWAAWCFLHPELPKRGGSDEHPRPAQRPAFQPARQPQDFCLSLHAAHLLHQLLLQADPPLPQGAAGASQADVQEGPRTFTGSRRNRYLARTQPFTQSLCPSVSSLYIGAGMLWRKGGVLFFKMNVQLNQFAHSFCTIPIQMSSWLSKESVTVFVQC